jgi:pectate lyase
MANALITLFCRYSRTNSRSKEGSHSVSDPIRPGNATSAARHFMIHLAVWLFATRAATFLWAGTTLDWKGGSGKWEDAVSWGGTLPSRTAEARINGTSDKPSGVILAHTNVLVNQLSVADGGNSRASLTLDGPSLTASSSMDVGKYNGSDGRFVMKSGHLFAGIIFVSGGGGPGQRGRGVIEIQGGTVVTKNFALGNSAGSHCTLHIVGSKASAIAVEDYLSIGVYNYLQVEKDPPPSATELIFDIDAEGVTPIFTWGKAEGQVRFPVPDNKGNGVGTCRLELHLLAAPPSGDILLIGSPKKCQGEFTGLPEGAAVRAEFENKTYEWKLTYRGGRTKCDIMLTNPHAGDAAGKMIPYTTAQKAKAFQFDRADVESAYREFYRQVDAQQTPLGSGTLAFPGAEGYGAYARGGRGGKVLFVTNLNDAGPGSLREAIETKGPRTVIFRVGGIIETKGLTIRAPYITIAGQTAPGDGICIKKTDSDGNALDLPGTHDVIIRFLRIRAGNNTGQFRSESFRASDSDNFIIDHCSCSWGNPETLSASGGSLDLYTVQWCIIAEGNNRQRHAFATALAGDRSAWHHNLFAHMEARVPRWGDITVRCDFRNNVLYDWGGYCGGGDLRTLNYVNNYLRPGPSSIQRYFIFAPKVALPASIYVNGNFMVGRPEVCADNWKGVDAGRSLEASVPFQAPPVQTQSAAEAFELVLRNAGATRPGRDSVDARIISDVRNGTGKIINDEKEVGGWPAYASGEPPMDTARDGIPDEWKKANGLKLNDPNAANAVNADGYTQLEVYLNSLVSP